MNIEIKSYLDNDANGSFESPGFTTNKYYAKGVGLIEEFWNVGRGVDQSDQIISCFEIN